MISNKVCYYVWKFNARKRVLSRVERRRHIGYADSISARFYKRSSANAWAKRNPDLFPYGYKVLSQPAS